MANPLTLFYGFVHFDGQKYSMAINFQYCWPENHVPL